MPPDTQSPERGIASVNTRNLVTMARFRCIPRTQTGSKRMKVKRIEHVGIVVRDVETGRKLWEGCFGIKPGGVEDNATRRWRN